MRRAGCIGSRPFFTRRDIHCHALSRCILAKTRRRNGRNGSRIFWAPSPRDIHWHAASCQNPQEKREKWEPRINFLCSLSFVDLLGTETKKCSLVSPVSPA